MPVRHARPLGSPADFPRHADLIQEVEHDHDGGRVAIPLETPDWFDFNVDHMAVDFIFPYRRGSTILGGHGHDAIQKNMSRTAYVFAAGDSVVCPSVRAEHRTNQRSSERPGPGAGIRLARDSYQPADQS